MENFIGPMIVTNGILTNRAVCFQDDFLGAGALVIPDTSAAESGVPWAKKIVGAGTPTVAGGASRAGGAIVLTLKANSEKEDAVLYHNDQKNFRITDGGIYDVVIKPTTLPSAAEVQFHALLSSNWADGPQTMTYLLGWDIDNTGALYANCDDNATDKRVSTGVTIAANDNVVLRIDFQNISDIRFYVAKNPTVGKRTQWQRVCSTTTFAWAASAANSILQPFFSLYKASGTGTGVVEVDYCGIAIKRANY